MSLINVPALYCPVPPQLCTYVDTADALTTEWIDGFHLIAAPDYDRYLDQRFAWMAARFYPYATLERLTILSQFFTLLFTIDDLLAGKDKYYLGKFIGQFMSIITENRYVRPGEAQPVFAALSDVWLRMANVTTKAWRASFTQSLVRMYEAAQWEQANVSKGRKIGLKKYIEIRAFLAAAHIATDCIALASDTIKLPPKAADNPQLQTIIRFCQHTVCWANDLFSLPKETLEGEYHNLVLVLQREFDITLDAAIMQAAALHDKEVTDMIALWSQVLIYDKQTNDTLGAYIMALFAIMRGNIDWSILETGRYYNFSYDGRELNKVFDRAPQHHTGIY